MKIDDQLQNDIDFDWFAVDEHGEIGHFATAGFKKLPASVASSAEDLTLIANFFLKEAPVRGLHQVEQTLKEEIPGWKGEAHEERYLRSFAAMADRGLFSYDIPSYLGTDTTYFLVASPTSPLHTSGLPGVIREIVSRTEIKGSFRERPRIPYEESRFL